jgi:hypothetical protein
VWCRFMNLLLLFSILGSTILKPDLFSKIEN